MAEPSAVSISSQAQAAVLPPHSLSSAPFAPTTLQIHTTSSLSAMITAVPPSHNPAPGPPKLSAKCITQPLMVEASSFSPFIIPTYPSTAGGKRHHITTIISSSDEISDSSDEDTPKKSTQMPSGSAVHQANVQMALPAVTGHVCVLPSLQFSSNTHIILQKMCGPCIKKGQPTCKAQRGAINTLMVTRKLCSKCKRLCDGPRPQWARSMFKAMQGGVYTFRFHH